MKKKILSFLVAVAVTLSLVSCDILSKNSGIDLPDDNKIEQENGEPIHTHAFSDATCTEPSLCECGEAIGEPLGHDMSSPTCKEASRCERAGCDHAGDVFAHHSPSHLYGGIYSYFACGGCNGVFRLGESWYLDGTHYEGMVGILNKGKYTTDENSQLPLITEKGEYQLLNITGQHEQLQLWVPSNTTQTDVFTSENDGVGFFSFRINAQVSDEFGMKFVDTNSKAARWSEGWCIQDEFFEVSNLYYKDGKVMVTVYGWDDVPLKVLEADAETEFSGWIDIAIGIVLDAETDSVILHYYVNGEYCTTLSKPLTTETNGINSVYIEGYTNKEGMGIYLDDIVFGYTLHDEWIFD